MIMPSESQVRPSTKKKRISRRTRLLKTLMDHPHRFMVYRTIGQSLTFFFLFLIPGLGIAKVDLWNQGNYVLMKEAPFKHALAGVCIGIVMCYVVTFVVNLLAGRLFCGWGCPVGETTRLGEKTKLPRLKRKTVMLLRAAGAAYSAGLVIAVMSWWVDLRVFLEPFTGGDLKAGLIAWSVFGIGALGAYLHAYFFKWSFCKNLCPVGLYYSVVSPAKHFGIHYRNQMDSCLNCDACVNVCPVGLDPRNLLQPLTENRGLSLTDAPSRNHCLECGDCIQACEFMINSQAQKQYSWEYHDACPHNIENALPLDLIEQQKPAIPLKLGWYSGNQTDKEKADT